MKIITLMLFFLMIMGCEVAPQKINYGHEGCSYCKMTIVDKKYASQMVAGTGKAYNFDAIECMINFRRENPDKNFKLYLVSNYENPGELIDASKASFLISKEILSPMGANLAAFNSEKKARKIQDLFGGDIYSWENLNVELADSISKANSVSSRH